MDDEDLLAALGDGMDVLARLDATGRFLRFVPGRAFVGRDPAALIGRFVEELLPPEDAARVRDGLARALATGEPQVVEHARPSQEGPRAVRARLTLARDGTVIAHIRDVTHEVEAQAALDKSHETLRLLARATTDAVFDWDVQGDRATWNEAITATFGYPCAVVSDRRWWSDRVHPDDVDEPRASMRAALAAPDVDLWTGSFRFRAADGRYADVIVRAHIVRDARGAAVRVVGSFLDVTQQRLLEQRLRTADRLTALGTFAAGLAHEVKNPLGATLGNLSLARRALAARAPGDEAAADEAPDGAAPDQRATPLVAHLADAEEGARRVAAIVDALATFDGRGETGGGKVDLRAVVERALLVAGRDLALRARLDVELPAVPPIQGDAQQLGQVVLNLLANAAHALSPDARGEQRVRIGLHDAGERLVLEVEDTGAGIAREHLPRLFDPYFTTKPVGVGTGLGLAICREIVEAHGGAIEAEAVEPHGALFRVSLPCSAAPAGVSRPSG